MSPERQQGKSPHQKESPEHPSVSSLQRGICLSLIEKMRKYLKINSFALKECGTETPASFLHDPGDFLLSPGPASFSRGATCLSMSVDIAGLQVLQLHFPLVFLLSCPGPSSRPCWVLMLEKMRACSVCPDLSRCGGFPWTL